MYLKMQKNTLKPKKFKLHKSQYKNYNFELGKIIKKSYKIL